MYLILEISSCAGVYFVVSFRISVVLGSDLFLSSGCLGAHIMGEFLICILIMFSLILVILPNQSFRTILFLFFFISCK
jgi:hypothetical protein